MPKPVVIRLLSYFAPLLLLWCWLAFAYTPRYATETQFVLRNQQDSSISLGAAGLLGGGGPEQQDLHMLREYAYSPNLFKILDQKLGLRAAYASSHILPPQRLAADANAETALKTYRDLVSLSIDSDSGIMLLEIQGFDPDLLMRQTELTLTEVEHYVNTAFRHIAERQAEAARETLENARLERAAKSDRLLAFQTQHHTFRPDLDGAAAQSALAALEAALAEEKARGAGLAAYLAPEASARIENETRIKAIDQQIASERSRLVPAPAKEDPAAFNRLLSSFQLLQLELDLATQRYSDALLALQRAQLVVSENLKSLVVISTPLRPDTAAYPRIWVWLLLAAVIQLFTHPLIAYPFLARLRREASAK